MKATEIPRTRCRNSRQRTAVRVSTAAVPPGSSGRAAKDVGSRNGTVAESRGRPIPEAGGGTMTPAASGDRPTVALPPGAAADHPELFSPERGRSLTGSTLAGRYLVQAVIGAGGSADVYQATDIRLDRAVAVKVLARRGWDGHGEQRFREEVRHLAAVSHRRLPLLLDAEPSVPPLFLVTPLIAGPTLAGLIRRGPCGPELVARVGAALAEALAYLHGRGVVHRDVKPANVLLGGPAQSGEVILSDLGIAHAQDSPEPTDPDCLIGTPGYLAPEVAKGQQAGPACDVYALGLVLLEALTGRCVYTGSPVERVTAATLRPPHVPAGIGGWWRDLIAWLTASDPRSRPTAATVHALFAAGASEC